MIIRSKYEVRSPKFEKAILFVLMIFCMVMLSLVTGCKTVKKTTQIQAKVETTQSDHVQVVTDSIVSVVVSDVVVDETETSDSLVVNEVTVVLSKPNSIGAQYPERIIYKESSNVKHTKNGIKQHKDSILTTNYQKQYIEDTKAHKKEQVSKTEKREVKKPPALMWLSIILGLAVTIIAYLILRRFNLIK